MKAMVQPWPLLFWLLACDPRRSDAVKPRRKKDDDSEKVVMPHHSFATPLSDTEMMIDWRTSGASIVETERLLLHPNVSEQAGFFWSKTPLLTNDFEVIMHFRVTGEKEISQVNDDQSFAMWYVYENVSDGSNEKNLIKAPSRRAGLEENGMSFGGFKPKFEGFGAVFSMVDAKKTPKAVVSGIWNDGSRQLTYGAGKDVPSDSAKPVDFRNTLNAAQFRVRVTPTSIVGQLKQSPSLSWNDCFALDRDIGPVRSGGYIGFTAWSGTASNSLTADTIAITQVQAYNHDTTSVGEELVDVSQQIQDAYREMLTDKNRHFADQKSQTEHLARLERMLSEHLNASKPADEKIFQDLEGLQNRMRLLDENGRTLTKELQVVVGADGSSQQESQSATKLKHEIVGLRRLFAGHSTSMNQKLQKVQKNIAVVKDEHAKGLNTMEEAVLAPAKQMSESMEIVAASRNKFVLVMLAIIGFVVGLFCLLHQKMQHYERKHFL